MIKITISGEPPRTIGYTDKKTGELKSFRTQVAYAHTLTREGKPQPFPEKIEVGLDRDQPPYPAGEYQLHPSSVWVGSRGRLELSPRLLPLTAARS